MADAMSRRSVELAETPWLAALPALSRFVLRGDGAVRVSAGEACGLTLPEQACRAAQADGRAALWLGPDEQLLLAPAEQAEILSSSLRAALAGQPHSLVDVSHRQVAFVVRGPHAEWLLESQCPLPLNLRDFPVGMCTRTVYAKAEIVLWRVGEQAFHVEVWRSFTGYVVGLLQEVARELGDA